MIPKELELTTWDISVWMKCAHAIFEEIGGSACGSDGSKSYL